MARVPGSDSMAPGATEAPQAASPSQPDDAVAIEHWGGMCLAELLLGRRLPLNPPFCVGCGYGHNEPNYPTHKGIDFYKTPGDVPVKRSCGFLGFGVSGANVYPAFPGCSHQATPNKARVVYAGNHDADFDTTRIGNCVILEHTDNTHEIWVRTIYMHLASVLVTVGQFVTTAQAIGTVGYTGGYTSTNAHLHFEINEQRPANFYWRVAGELAIMPDNVVANRPAIDPEIYLPDVAGGELLRVAEVPPPAQVPAGPPSAFQGLLDPIWLTYRHPFSGETSTVRVDSFDADSNPRWYLGGDGTAFSVKPLCDGPDGQAIVVRVYQTDVTLVHLDQNYRVMVVTEYEGLDNINVSVGDRVDLETVLGTGDSVEVYLYRRKATSSTEWASGEPFTWPTILGVGGQLANHRYWADPACCLPEPVTFSPTGGSPTWDYGRDCDSEPGWA